MNRRRIERKISQLYEELERVQLRLLDDNLNTRDFVAMEIKEVQLLNRIERLEELLEECEDEGQEEFD